ncbi:Uncharacterised protein [Mycoplasmopsis maculosa]|uniref:Uncharacterized protein n=1 Tax=Mycoplasmopsis maculosa TaxID=114885 RepID=A0A449B480_9BACT|nr:hypothetical protein [Mycoplasmopsis maculosa]VEU75414.1 Uncharacterised protein [Mycoplasmopsis maculosa]
MKEKKNLESLFFSQKDIILNGINYSDIARNKGKKVSKDILNSLDEIIATYNIILIINENTIISFKKELLNNLFYNYFANKNIFPENEEVLFNFIFEEFGIDYDYYNSLIKEKFFLTNQSLKNAISFLDKFNFNYKNDIVGAFNLNFEDIYKNLFLNTLKIYKTDFSVDFFKNELINLFNYLFNVNFSLDKIISKKNINNINNHNLNLKQNLEKIENRIINNELEAIIKYIDLILLKPLNFENNIILKIYLDILLIDKFNKRINWNAIKFDDFYEAYINIHKNPSKLINMLNKNIIYNKNNDSLNEQIVKSIFALDFIEIN